MLGKTVSSEIVDLGEVNLTACKERSWGNIVVEGGFVSSETITGKSSVQALGELAIVDGVLDMIIPKILEPPLVKDFMESLAALVSQVDSMYRQHREINPKQRLGHSVTFRRGRGRESSLFSILNPLFQWYSYGSLAHFDRLGDRDGIIATSGGVPTRIFTGPVKKFSDNVITSRLPFLRLFSPMTELIPDSHAILIDENTLHKQPPQRFKKYNPSVFFRTAIEKID